MPESLVASGGATATLPQRATVEARDLTIEYERRREKTRLVALHGFTLTVYAGEFLAVLGPSGCGKTTFINTVAGLLPPSEGTITVGGKPIEGPGPDRAMVFQEYALMPWLSAWDNVAFGLDLQGRLKQPGGRDTVQRFIELVGLRGFERSYPHELSGGMRQRVGLARALVTEPQILLMDEPFAAVDAMTREVMQGELERILAQTGQTVIFITHSIDEAITLGDRIVVISSRPGQIREIIPVPLPRPRWEYDTKAHPLFVPIREHAWGLLQKEVQGNVARGG
ncbi:MAG: ABC transporter ATP-binding protein [Chloroflexi bacterium]|nr:ABC transporter ATP-binding protein [Chloroflexota bacterium]